jgi:DNA-directed RNA polymerase specialized sigma24 family protein
MALDPKTFMPMVKNVARSVSSAYPAFITAEDTEQALWLWLYDRRASVLQTVEDSPEDWEAKIASTMRKVAFDHCAREKAAVEGYSTDDLYRYSIPKIRALLPDVFSYTDWQTFGMKGDGQPTAKGQANETGDRIAELVDVRAALERLPDDTKALIFLVQVWSYTAENVAEHFDLTLDAAKKRIQRSLGSLQRELGRKSPDEEPRVSDRRTVRSNAAARAAVSNQYEG